MPYAPLKNLLVRDFLRGMDGHDPYSQFCDVGHTRFAGARSDDAFREAQNIDLHLYLPGDILTKVDRASMNCGLEVRVPFLDRKVFEWVASLPTEMIFLHGKRKGLLSEAARTLLPETILTQPKRGFSVPLDAWFRGELMPILQERIDGAAARLDGIVNRNFVNEIISRHRSGRIQAGTFLFALLAFCVFLDNGEA
jgi:asparagine synthase (glutamine-hydrolysing)